MQLGNGGDLVASTRHDDGGNKPSINVSEVRRLRFKRRLTQQMLASRAGLSVGQVSRIESGNVEMPHFSTVDKLAEALGVDPDDLMNS